MLDESCSWTYMHCMQGVCTPTHTPYQSNGVYPVLLGGFFKKSLSARHPYGDI